MSGLNGFWWVLLNLLLGVVVTPVHAGEDFTGKSPTRQEQDKRREEYQKLSPEEREAKLKEWRKTNSGPARAEWDKRRDQLKNMSPEEREAKRVELKTRLEKRVAELRSKQTSAPLTPPELRELERREHILQRFGQEKTDTARPPIPAVREPAAPVPPSK